MAGDQPPKSVIEAFRESEGIALTRNLLYPATCTYNVVIKMEIARDTLEISVLIYPQDSIWVAQGVEHDIAAHGENPVEASEQFNDKIRAELIVSLDLGDPTPLSGIDRAPRVFEEMYRRAKFQIVDKEVSLDIAEANSPRLRPHIKITDEKQVA